MDGGDNRMIYSAMVQGLLALLVTGVAVYFLFEVWKMTRGSMNEGFAGPAKGSGSPDCLRSSVEAAKIYEIFSTKAQLAEEGPDNLRELTLLLSKTCCLKKDLLGVAGLVEATRYQPYSTAHDIEPVAETAARCFAKTIPPRDLEISLDKWTNRGNELLRLLCGSTNISDSDVQDANRLFKNHMKDLSDVLKTSCIKGEVSIAGKLGPRDVVGYSPLTLLEYGKYNGYY
jgi:hypothetical protein